MPASIAASVVTISDSGAGVQPEVLLTITLGSGETASTRLLGASAIGLTAAQVTALQNAVDALRTKAIAVTKGNFSIP